MTLFYSKFSHPRREYISYYYIAVKVLPLRKLFQQKEKFLASFSQKTHSPPQPLLQKYFVLISD